MANLLCLVVSLQRRQQALVSKMYSACAGISKRKRLPTDKAQPSPDFW